MTYYSFLHSSVLREFLKLSVQFIKTGVNVKFYSVAAGVCEHFPCRMVVLVSRPVNMKVFVDRSFVFTINHFRKAGRGCGECDQGNGGLDAAAG